MTGKHRSGATRLRVLLMACLFLLAAAAAIPLGIVAQSGGGYDLSWSTVDGGGYTFSTGGGFSLGGTAGQPDAGLLAGGQYSLAGGFWPGAPLVGYYRVYLPLILHNYP